jgi:hypothetical protein
MAPKMKVAFPLVLLCAAAAAVLLQHAPPLGGPNRDEDARAIYSWVISHLTLRDKLYLIVPETRRRSYPDDVCLQIPRSHATDFREIRADFDRNKEVTRELPLSFSTEKAYVVLDSEIAKELLKSGRLFDSPIIGQQFAGAEHLLLFSNVSFNRERSLALVHIDVWCGGLCGESWWIVLGKDNGVWNQRPWSGCRAIA